MIKKATYQDLNQIMALCHVVTCDLNRQHIDQWDAQYPGLDIFIADIAEESLYGHFEGENLLGLITLNRSAEPEYDTVNWTFESDAVGIIHRLMVHPETQTIGIASELLNFAEATARQQNIDVIRLDVFEKNHKAIRFYKRRGYQKAGEVTFRKGNFDCMEKRIGKEPDKKD